jgi:glycosyltransferase involved in cell wall biosynthesis
MLNAITPLLLTYNEAPNIARTLAKLSWAREVVIVDSHSTDRTRELAIAAHRGVRWHERAFTTHAEQWNFGLTATGITTEWVLALDADFILTDALVKELEQLAPDAETSGYQAAFDYCIEGRPLRGAAYPPVVVLFRRSTAVYEQDGHTQRVRVSGAIRRLGSRILHDDRKPLSHWLASQIRYMRLEAEKLATTPAAGLTFPDRIRRQIVFAAPAMFVYCLVGRGGILDGWRGVYYAGQRACAELILSLFLLDRRVVGVRTAADR